MTLNCIAIDDEPLALQQIELYVRQTDFLQSVGSFHQPHAAKELIDGGQKVDLMFVDINMPDISGLDLVRSIESCPLVIFTTAHSQYAIEGYRVDAIDYLLKPISYADFLRSAQKALRYCELMATNQNIQPAQSLFVRSEYKMIKIEVSDILYIESRSEYVRIYIADSKPIMTLGSLRSYQQRLHPAGFIQTHRSYLINPEHVSSIERRTVLINHNKQSYQIPIGDMYEENLRQLIGRSL